MASENKIDDDGNAAECCSRDATTANMLHTPAPKVPPVAEQSAAGVLGDSSKEGGHGWFYLDSEAQSQGPYHITQLTGNLISEEITFVISSTINYSKSVLIPRQ